MSRPSWSVPSQNTPPSGATVPGGLNGSRFWFGGNGAITGARIARTTQNSTISTPISPTQLSRSSSAERSARKIGLRLSEDGGGSEISAIPTPQVKRMRGLR